MNNTCSKERMDSLKDQTEYIYELLQQICWYMPLTYIALSYVFEGYILCLNQRSISSVTFILWYLYIFFVNYRFYNYAQNEIDRLDLEQWDCIDEKWQFQIQLFRTLLSQANWSLYYLIIFENWAHLLIVLYFLSLQVQDEMFEAWKLFLLTYLLFTMALFAFMIITSGLDVQNIHRYKQRFTSMIETSWV